MRRMTAERISLRPAKDLKKALTDMAASEQRSVSNMAEVLILEALQARGAKAAKQK